MSNDQSELILKSLKRQFTQNANYHNLTLCCLQNSKEHILKNVDNQKRWHLTTFLKVSSFMFYSKNMEDYTLLLYPSYLLLDILTFPKDFLSLICQTNLVISSPFKTAHKTHVHFQVGWCTLDFRNVAWHQPIRSELAISARSRAQNASGSQCMDCGRSVGGTYGTQFQLGWSECSHTKDQTEGSVSAPVGVTATAEWQRDEGPQQVPHSTVFSDRSPPTNPKPPIVAPKSIWTLTQLIKSLGLVRFLMFLNEFLKLTKATFIWSEIICYNLWNICYNLK